MSKNEFKTMEMVRRIRDAHYEQLKDKTIEQRIAFYREQSRALHAELDQKRAERQAASGAPRPDQGMQRQDFTLILSTPEQSEADADALYGAGCDDGTIITSGGVTRIEFHRQAPTLEDAIRSAIADVRSAGFEVAHVQMEPESVIGAGGRD